MIDLSADLYTPAPTTTPPVQTVVVQPPARAEMIWIKISPAPGASDLLTPTEDWTWQELRDYVVRQLQERDIRYPAIPAERLASIFKSFHTRWGTRAAAIATYAFQQCDGLWLDSPITPTRFSKKSDQYFAAVIAERLHLVAA